ncbi:MAG: phosphate ABC transporter substrate-binding/OmpA family protein [Pseudomonadota bacterium]
MTKRQTGYRLSTAIALVIAAAAATAETVTLTSREGGVQITGELVSYDGTSYVIDSILGRNRIDAAAVTCEGPGCPGDEISFNATVAVIDQPAASLLDSLLTGFARGRDLGLTRENAGASFAFDLTQGDDTEAGRIEASVLQQQAAFEALFAGDIDFLVSTRPIDPDLANTFVERGFVDLRSSEYERVVALDAIVPLVHPENPVRAITLPEFGQIAAGRITNWNELNGPDMPIRVILPEADSTIGGVFEDRIVRPNRLRVAREVERANEADARATVNADRTAITLASAALAAEARPVPVQLACGPVALPNAFSVKSEEYPLTRRMVIYTSDRPLSPEAQEFLAYTTSAAAQAQISDTGFVDQNVQAMPVALQGTRLASAILSMEGEAVINATRALVENLASAERLSTTFRFTAGSERLDNKALRDIERMADYLIDDGFNKREILLFGFTDNVGRADLNQRLALERAESVRQAILASAGGQIAPDQIRASSYGSIAPVGCNETIEGRASNRRVEVWVR